MKGLGMIIPIGERVLIRVEEAPKFSKGGITIPEGAREEPQRGEILKMGMSSEAPDGPHYGIGSVIVFRRYSGVKVKDGDEELLILDEKDILAVVG